MRFDNLLRWLKENYAHVLLFAAAILSAFITGDINGVVVSLFTFIAIEMFIDKIYYQKKLFDMVKKKRDIFLGKEILANVAEIDDRHSKAKEIIYVGSSNTIFHRFSDPARKCLQKGGRIVLVYTDPNSSALEQMAVFLADLNLCNKTA